MVAKYFFPETTLKQVKEISNSQKGYVVWAFKFWLWIMNKGIRITEYDTLDYKAWANEGISGLKKSVPEKEFNFYLENTKDILSYASDIKKVLKHPSFNLFKQKPTFALLEDAVGKDAVCEVVLDSRTLRKLKGFSLHRVVVIDISGDEVVFHDPAYGPNDKASKEDFRNSWLKAVAEPELCIYERL